MRDYLNSLMAKMMSREMLEAQKLALDESAIVAETDLHGRITYVNQKFLDISKYERDELIGQDHRILNSKFHNKEFFKNLWKTISSGQIWHGEIRNRAKDGSIYWVDTTIFPVNSKNGTPIKYIAIRFDITEKKRIVEELQMANTKAHVAAQAKAEFLANMSHEIRTPMNAIVGMTEILRETMLNNDQKRIVNTLQNACDALLNIINNILDLSKIEAGKLEVEHVPFDIENLVSNTCEIMSSAAQKKGLEFLCYVQPEIQDQFKGDPNKIQQILINLIGNAIKFTKTGDITVSAEIFQNNEDADIIEFKVTDTGIGIPQADFSKLFKNFSQVSNSYSREYGGTGLGLSISKKLTEALGGTISFDSEVNKGSCFYFRLPLYKVRKSKRSNLHVWPNKIAIMKKNQNSVFILKNYIQYLLIPHKITNSVDQLELALSEKNEIDCVIASICTDGDDQRILDLVRKYSVKKLILIFNSTEQTFFKPTHLDGVNITYLKKPYRRTELFTALDKNVNIEIENNKETEQKVQIETDQARILLADDVDTNLDMVKAFLKELPLSIDIAHNGAEAYDLATKYKYDLILMDIQMPILDGRMATQKIRSYEKDKKISPTKIIALSAHATTEEIQESLNVGCDGHLVKPIKKKNTRTSCSKLLTKGFLEEILNVYYTCC